jgi:hypothetical protein
VHSENLQQKEKRIAALTLELDADGDMVEDGVSVLTLDGLHLDEMVALGDDPLLPDQAVPARVHHLTLFVLQIHGT